MIDVRTGADPTTTDDADVADRRRKQSSERGPEPLMAWARPPCRKHQQGSIGNVSVHQSPPTSTHQHPSTNSDNATAHLG